MRSSGDTGDILETVGRTKCNPVSPAMSAMPRIDDSLDQPLDCKVYKNAKLVGKLMDLANCTRPDSAAAVRHLSRYRSKPTRRHWEQGKRVLRYLKGTMDYSINYDSSSSPFPQAWQDASYGDGPEMLRASAPIGKHGKALRVLLSAAETKLQTHVLNITRVLKG